ncbi:MAG: tRNA adenosine(34) deaminase TadA [Thermodesulfobacteriota bacterium]|nr:tRNA adenosine(34) deaminase TadA [Thermodesulfobacteriota bacterium]
MRECVGDEYFMEMALDEAQKAREEQEVPIGAVLVMGDMVIRGHNRVIMDSDPSAHAEIMVIREAAKKIGNYRLSKAVLYITLEPCIMCAGAIVHSRIDRLVFGAFDPRYGAAGSLVDAFDLGLNHTPKVVSGILAGRSSALLKGFFQKKR